MIKPYNPEDVPLPPIDPESIQRYGVVYPFTDDIHPEPIGPPTRAMSELRERGFVESLSGHAMHPNVAARRFLPYGEVARRVDEQAEQVAFMRRCMAPFREPEPLTEYECEALRQLIIDGSFGIGLVRAMQMLRPREGEVHREMIERATPHRDMPWQDPLWIDEAAGVSPIQTGPPPDSDLDRIYRAHGGISTPPSQRKAPSEAVRKLHPLMQLDEQIGRDMTKGDELT